MADAVVSVGPLSFPAATPDPFLFCVYHKDNYPAGDDKMQAPKVGNGADFDPNAAYRMYHGSRIPGFPQHPHRGFETLTCTMEGLVDHTDSLGNAGRYGQGDLQWMTAGQGIVHAEMFPLVHMDRPNTLRLFQLWLNLPSHSKMVKPSFVMHWAPDIPQVVSEDGKSKVTVYAGNLLGAKACQPPPDSWAADEAHDVGVWLVTMAPGSEFVLPAAAQRGTKRSAYFIEGDGLTVGTRALKGHAVIQLNGALPVPLRNTGAQEAQVLVLQGQPLGEPVAQHGPFVMTTQQEIQQAFRDYQRTGFGGWPWEADDHVFPPGKGRFALMNGKESYPPS